MAKNLDYGNPTSARYSAGALFVFYLMITLEIIMMASPFATYYYVAYGPVLKFLDSHYLTKWLGAFFLPHMIFPSNPIFTFLRGLCVLLFYGGILIFISAAIPLYYRKFRHPGLVTGGLYNYVRHPQYLGLSVWGLGLLLFWPRFFILVAYIIMIFLYYLLAKNEEARFAIEDYNSYRQSTGMFFPHIKGVRLNLQPLAHIQSPSLKAGVAFILAMGISIGLGFALRAFTISQLPQIYLKNMRVVSVKQLPDAEMEKIVQALLADSEIKSRIDSKTTYLAYLMPQHYKMAALIARVPDEKKQDKGRFHFMTNVFHNFIMGLQGKSYLKTPGMGAFRIIFLKVSREDNSPLPPASAFDIYIKRTPVFYADIEPQTGGILVQQPLTTGNKWGNLPQSVF